MPESTIRRAVPEDAGAMAVCLEAAYADVARRIPDMPDVAGDCAGEIARHEVWVAESDGMLAGVLVLIPADDFLKLANVAVHPDSSGTGLGRLLIAHAETRARAHGFRELRLTTHAAMPENVSLYEHLGWTVAGREGHKVFMSKTVEPGAAP